MFRSLIIVTIMLVKNIYTQDIIGTSCILESPNYPGICKLLIQCKEIRDEVVFHQKLPQTCGFEETQPIVCCPKPRRPGYMSESKCREYATYTKEKPLCGHSIVKRVVGGIPAGKTQFPHMALLGYRILSRYSVQWLCGGSLISEQYILTSGSCMYTEQ
ncbi:serine protease snake-like [Zophobas morio]|uniref:serine protease snake-like n=1 Tax=Zophobas morio TaxID=2755281 RepID=UPI00308346D3